MCKMVGAWVFPALMAGITDASTTLAFHAAYRLLWVDNRAVGLSFTATDWMKNHFAAL